MINLYPEVKSIIEKCGMNISDTYGVEVNANPSVAEITIYFYVKDEVGNFVIENDSVKKDKIKAFARVIKDNRDEKYSFARCQGDPIMVDTSLAREDIYNRRKKARSSANTST